MESPSIELSQQKWLQINYLSVSMAKLNDIEQIRRVFLEQLAFIIPHKKAFFDIGNMRDGAAVFFDPLSLNMTDEELSAYYEHYQASDYVAWLLPGEGPVIYRDSQIITHEARKKTTIYQRWMKPMGVYYSMGSTLYDNGILYGSITLFRDETQDFSDEDVYVLQILNEHISANLSCLYPNGIRKSLAYKSDSAITEKYHVTVRENEIIALIFKGLSNREIGEKLFITENTVKKHVNTIFHKLNVSTRTQLIQMLYSSRNSMLPEAPTE
ncbi:MAG: LuxR C-terminal-related transcriptional regulator [Oscillospiraceae bacterium]